MSFDLSKLTVAAGHIAVLSDKSRNHIMSTILPGEEQCLLTHMPEAGKILKCTCSQAHKRLQLSNMTRTSSLTGFVTGRGLQTTRWVIP